MSDRQDLQVRHEADGAAHILHLSGELDLNSAGRLESFVGELCTDGAERIVLDLGDLSFMDSTGLRSLLVSKELSSVAGCRLQLAALTGQVRRLLELTGLEGAIETASPNGD